MVATIRVFLVDDNGAILSDLQDELGDKFEIAGTAQNGEEALQAIQRLNPDVLVLDITMPGLNGLQVAARVHGNHPRMRILFLTIHEEPEYVSAAFNAGALGYVSKRRLASDLAPAIREVFEGRTYLSPTLHR